MVKAMKSGVLLYSISIVCTFSLIEIHSEISCAYCLLFIQNALQIHRGLVITFIGNPLLDIGS